jgi:hypothetical protein
MDEVEAEPGELPLGSDSRIRQPDRRHEVPARQLGEDPGVDPVGLAGERGEALHLPRVGDLDRPAEKLEGVVDEAGAVHRLDDGEDLLGLAVGAGDRADEAPQPVTIGRCRRHLERRAVLGHEVDVEAVP